MKHISIIYIFAVISGIIFLALYHPEFFYSFIKERYEIYLHGNISLGEKARYTYFIKCNSILKTMTHKTIIILIKTLSAIARS